MKKKYFFHDERINCPHWGTPTPSKKPSDQFPPSFPTDTARLVICYLLVLYVQEVLSLYKQRLTNCNWTLQAFLNIQYLQFWIQIRFFNKCTESDYILPVVFYTKNPVKIGSSIRFKPGMWIRSHSHSFGSGSRGIK